MFGLDTPKAQLGLVMENNMNNVTVNKIKYENCTIIDRRLYFKCKDCKTWCIFNENTIHNKLICDFCKKRREVTYEKNENGDYSLDDLEDMVNDIINSDEPDEYVTIDQLNIVVQWIKKKFKGCID